MSILSSLTDDILKEIDDFDKYMSLSNGGVLDYVTISGTAHMLIRLIKILTQIRSLKIMITTILARLPFLYCIQIMKSIMSYHVEVTIA